MSEENNIIELIDEDGNPTQFEHLATLEHEGNYYIVLMLPEDEVLEFEDEDEDDGNVIIMGIEKDEEGTDCYVCVEDEALLEVLFGKFLALVEGEEDEEDEAEADE